MTILATTLAAFAAFEVLAYRYGAESRPAFTERPETHPRRSL